MRAALSDISPEDRQLLHMLVIDESSVEDVADRLAVTANTVRVRLHRARRRLGSHYLRRAGHHSLALPALGVAALRRLLRPSAGTATRSAPALAAVAALGGLTAATVVLTQPSDAPQHPWSAAATEQQAYGDPQLVTVRTPNATAPAVRSSARIAGASHTGGSSSPSTPMVKTRLKVGDPKKPGTTADTGITVGPVWVSMKVVRSSGDGVICMVTHRNC
jgi:hypothetical protein